MSVFVHAIGQAATFDLDLVARISNATLYEARAVGQVVYRASGGTVRAGTSCDGGPLANSVHDARWGRISECYGEDPMLAALVGATATRALQNRSADSRWLGTSQVIRHWLGYHMASPDLPRGGEEAISLHAFADQQAPIYRAHLVDGGAEGLMCAYASFSIGTDPANASAPAPLVPSCVHPFLWEKLREEWNWHGFVQTDCCDSITSMVDDHQFYPDVKTAALAAIEAGVAAYFGFNGGLVAGVGEMLASGALDAQLFDDRLRRTLLARFRMGEFDARNGAGEYPYDNEYDEAQLDGAAHRALQREAVAASLVLLENEGAALPLAAGSALNLAVIGPFADCSVADENAGGDRDSPLRCSYGHTYEGTSGPVSTFLSAAREEPAFASVAYAQGSNIRSAFNGSAGVAAAAAAAAAADATLLVLGLGELLEVEGLDRSTLLLPQPQRDLLAAVAAAATRGPLVVVVVSAGLADLGAVAYAGARHALVQSFYGGAETGHGAMDVLLGRVAPSARLPLTGYREGYLAALGDSIANFSLVSSTGVGRTYRYLDDASLVSYWFGFGLSYSSFAYSNATVAVAQDLPGPGAPESAPVATVTAFVRNAGAVAAREVAQVYVSVPADAAARAAVGSAPIPLTALQGFSKTPPLEPGAPAQQVSFSLPLRAFLTTTASGQRVLTGGNFTVYVSGHSPFDAKGLAASNVVSVTVELPAQAV